MSCYGRVDILFFITKRVGDQRSSIISYVGFMGVVRLAWEYTILLNLDKYEQFKNITWNLIRKRIKLQLENDGNISIDVYLYV